MISREAILYILDGRPFAGKTTLGTKIAAKEGIAHTDFNKLLKKHGLEGKDCSNDQFAEIDREAEIKAIENYIRIGKDGLLDVTPFTKDRRDAKRGLAHKFNAFPVVIHVEVSEEEARGRWQRNISTHERELVHKNVFEYVMSHYQPPYGEDHIKYKQGEDSDEWMKNVLYPYLLRRKIKVLMAEMDGYGILEIHFRRVYWPIYEADNPNPRAVRPFESGQFLTELQTQEEKDKRLVQIFNIHEDLKTQSELSGLSVFDRTVVFLQPSDSEGLEQTRHSLDQLRRKLVVDYQNKKPQIVQFYGGLQQQLAEIHDEAEKILPVTYSLAINDLSVFEPVMDSSSLQNHAAAALSQMNNFLIARKLPKHAMILITASPSLAGFILAEHYNKDAMTALSISSSEAKSGYIYCVLDNSLTPYKRPDRLSETNGRYSALPKNLMMKMTEMIVSLGVLEKSSTSSNMPIPKTDYRYESSRLKYIVWETPAECFTNTQPFVIITKSSHEKNTINNDQLPEDLVVSMDYFWDGLVSVSMRTKDKAYIESIVDKIPDKKLPRSENLDGQSHYFYKNFRVSYYEDFSCLTYDKNFPEDFPDVLKTFMTEILTDAENDLRESDRLL